MHLGISNAETEKFVEKYSDDLKQSFAGVLASDRLNRFRSCQN